MNLTFLHNLFLLLFAFPYSLSWKTIVYFKKFSIIKYLCRNYEGPNYEIILGDALDQLAKFRRAGHLFHLIILDLTDVLIDSTGAQGSSLGRSDLAILIDRKKN